MPAKQFTRTPQPPAKDPPYRPTERFFAAKGTTGTKPPSRGEGDTWKEPPGEVSPVRPRSWGTPKESPVAPATHRDAGEHKQPVKGPKNG